MKNTKKAFTLVELLIVVAIIGVLSALLIPALSLVQRKVKASRTQDLLVSISNGLKLYDGEYESFPNFLANRDRINLNTSSYAEDLVKTLTGRTPEGDKLSSSDRKSFNKKSKEFINFEGGNLVQLNEGSKWSIVDAFGNPNIYISVDSDRNGVIRKGFPTTGDGLTEDEFKEKVPNRTVGVRKTAIAFTLAKDSNKSGADYEAENVFSW